MKSLAVFLLLLGELFFAIEGVPSLEYAEEESTVSPLVRTSYYLIERMTRSMRGRSNSAAPVRFSSRTSLTHFSQKPILLRTARPSAFRNTTEAST